MRKLLVREIKRIALTRLEEAARTPQDFEEVLAEWNRNDRTRMSKERKYEIGRGNEDMLHWDKVRASDTRGKFKDGLDTVIPRPIEFPWWRQVIRGDFIDTIYDCPFEVHELVGNQYAYNALKNLSDNHKEILYYRAVRLYSNMRIANIRNQTDRNIRKTWNLLLNNLHDELAVHGLSGYKSYIDSDINE